jgi:riboflavin biosynthesis pyrimidine reductase
VPGPVESGRLLSGGEASDRFVMGLLRGLADAVVVGAGTFRRADGDLWYPESVRPEDGVQLVKLRRELGLAEHPVFAVVTASGVIDPTQVALRDSLVITTPRGEARLRGLLPKGATVVVMGQEPIAAQSILDFLHQTGFERILVEGGPTLLGHFLQANLVDELFLTTAPRLFGRVPGDQRRSLLEDGNFDGRAATLMSLRRHGSFLFARYGIRRAG